MKRIVKFPVENENTFIYVEVDEPSAQSWDEISNGEAEIAKATKTLEQAIDTTIKPAATAIIGKLRGLSDRPDEIQVEFGLKLTAELGAILASASVEANYQVTLKWTPSNTKSSTKQT